MPEIERLYALALAGLPPASEIPRSLHVGMNAYQALLLIASGSSPMTMNPVSRLGAVDVVLGGNTSSPDEWILYAADGSEMKRGYSSAGS